MLRGWFHAAAVIPAAAGASVLAAGAAQSPAERAAVALYGAALILLFGVSALYHRGRWSPRLRAVWQRLDHANIFLMIAATYTVVAVTVLDAAPRTAILIAVWATALCGMVLVTAPIRLPRTAMVFLYIATGWMAIVVIPALAGRVSGGELALLLGGGALYSVGALAYAARRPRLWPRVFGYHEVFHLLVIAASALFFAFVALSVTTAGRV